MDKINDKYGEFMITPALMMGMRRRRASRLQTRSFMEQDGKETVSVDI
jgi:hypothetical protein